MPNPLPPETTPEWTEQDEVDLRDFARFIGPDFTPSAKAAYRFAREIRRLRSEREAQDAEIAKLRAELAATREAGTLARRDAVICGADRLSGSVAILVRRGVLDARSVAGDALLDYAGARYGDSDPIGNVERRYGEVQKDRSTTSRSRVSDNG